MILGPGTDSQFLLYQEQLSFLTIALRHTTLVDFFESNTFVSRTNAGKVAMFAYLKCFPKLVWALVFLSAFIISVTAILATKHFKSRSLRDLFWSYTSLLTCQPMQLSHIRSVPYLITGLWLTSALVFTTQFSAYFFDNLIKGVPIDVINTIEELSERDHIKVVVRDDSLLSKFAATDTSSTARALSTHINEYFDFESEDIEHTIMKGLTNGSVAYVNDRLILLFTLIGLREQFNFSYESLHISTESSVFQPYFLLTNEMIPKWSQKYLDIVYGYRQNVIL